MYVYIYIYICTPQRWCRQTRPPPASTPLETAPHCRGGHNERQVNVDGFSTRTSTILVQKHARFWHKNVRLKARLTAPPEGAGQYIGVTQGYLTYKKTHPPRTLP